MIKVKVKTLWQGKVGVRDKYVNACREQEQDLVVVHGGGAMSIPHYDLDRRTHGVSREVFKDVHSKNTVGHRLVYFLWKPTVEQGKMELQGGVAAAD